jgi:hypothetical protein
VVRIQADTNDSYEFILHLKLNFYGYPFLVARINVWFCTSTDKYIAAPIGSRYSDSDGNLLLSTYTESLQYLETEISTSLTIPWDQFPSGRYTIYPHIVVRQADTQNDWLIYGRQQGASSIVIKRN